MAENVTYNKFNSWIEGMVEGVNLQTDTLKVALTNTAPTASNSVLGDLTTVSTANLDSVTLTVSSSTQTGGTYKIIVADKVMTASGSVGPFRYLVVYDDTAANDPLICWFDYGASVTLAANDTFTFKHPSGVELFSVA